MPIYIRNFREADLATLYEIDQVCFPPGIAFSSRQLTRYLGRPQSIARVAEESGGIVGFAVAQIEGPGRARVLTLDVLPEARRLKVGTRLMTALHGGLRNQGVQAVFLEVGVGNVAARNLYEGLEYQYLGVLAGYYQGREDAYRMGRTL